MSNITCIIVEDEPLAAKVLTEYVAQVPFLELKGTFKDAILATDITRESRNQFDRRGRPGPHSVLTVPLGVGPKPQPRGSPGG